MRKLLVAVAMALAVLPPAVTAPPAVGDVPPSVVFDAAAAAGVAHLGRDWSAATGDINGDGRVDIVYGAHSYGPLEVLLNDGHGHFVRDPAEFPTLDRHSCGIADFDGDARADIYCNVGGGRGTGVKSNELWLQQPDGSFLNRAPEWGVADPLSRGRSVAVLDVNRDGRPDLFIGQSGSRGDTLVVPGRMYLNLGSSFREAPEYAADHDMQAMCAQATDYDGDGWTDLLTCGAFVHLWHNNAGTSMTQVPSVQGAGSGITDASAGTTVVDINGDGRADIVRVIAGALTAQTQKADHTFNPAATLRSLSNGYGVAAGDFDGDGHVDLYVLQTGAADDALLRGNGAGGFVAAPIPQADAGAGVHVAALDYDADGRTDFLVLNGRERVAGPVQLITSKQCTVWGTDGDDTLLGTDDGDVMCGFGGNDTIDGGAGADVLLGGEGVDSLFGQAGDDVLNGQGGADLELGGEGNDVYDQDTAANGADQLGGVDDVGIDTVDYSRRSAPVTVTVGAASDDGAAEEADAVGVGVELVRGGTASDALTGGPGDDTLIGGPGEDHLDGGPGHDLLEGGPGSDEEIGGDGDDRFEQWFTRGEGGYAGDDQPIVNGATVGDSFSGGGGYDIVDYSRRHVDVRPATLDDVANDGEDGGDPVPGASQIGENDNIGADIENVPINQVVLPASIAFNAVPVDTPTGQRATVSVTVRDPSGAVMAGVPVLFVISGQHPGASGAAVTTSEGIATFAWLGSRAGDDTVVARPFANADGVPVPNGTVVASAVQHWIGPAPPSRAASLGDGNITPTTLTVPVGTSVTWTNNAAAAHSVIETVRLGPGNAPLFASGALAPGDTYTYGFNFAATYRYKDATSGATGAVRARIGADKTSGTTSTVFTLTLGATALPSHLRLLLQVRRPGASAYTNLLDSAQTTTTFKPNRGTGSYLFRARVHTLAGKASAWSPVLTLTVR